MVYNEIIFRAVVRDVASRMEERMCGMARKYYRAGYVAGMKRERKEGCSESLKDIDDSFRSIYASGDTFEDGEADDISTAQYFGELLEAVALASGHPVAFSGQANDGLMKSVEGAKEVSAEGFSGIPF